MSVPQAGGTSALGLRLVESLPSGFSAHSQTYLGRWAMAFNLRRIMKLKDPHLLIP